MKAPPARVLTIQLALSFAAVLLLGACQPLLGDLKLVTPSPLPTPSPTGLTSKTTNVVAVYIDAEKNTTVGNSARVTLIFEPLIYTITRRSNGSVYSISKKPWDSNTLNTMKLCTSLDKPCTLNTRWDWFEENKEVEIPVDWVGPRQFWINVAIRDQRTRSVPTVIGDTNNFDSQLSTTLNGIIDERTPVAEQPPVVQTYVAGQSAKFPVTGSVKIQGSPCCVGGKVGERVEIQVEFRATSPFAQVTQMRTAPRCVKPEEMGAATWEPFAPRKIYTTTAALNFVGWYIAVQYQDAAGNLSPVYCDDISVEGQP